VAPPAPPVVERAPATPAAVAPPPAWSGSAGSLEPPHGNAELAKLPAFAAFTAACGKAPEPELAGVRASYGLSSEAEHVDVDRWWRERFQAEPELGARFLSLHRHYRRVFGEFYAAKRRDAARG
jgi:hypothetical protein